MSRRGAPIICIRTKAGTPTAFAKQQSMHPLATDRITFHAEPGRSVLWHQPARTMRGDRSC